jgi:hypothetical protein
LAFIIQTLQSIPNGNLQAKRLAVVTYAEKPAKEINDRFFSKFPQKTTHCYELQEVCMQRLESVFCGTIHALAPKILKSHCVILGLCSNFEVIQEDKSLWRNFIISIGYALGAIPEDIRNDFYASMTLINCRNVPKIKNIIEIPEDMNTINMPDIDIPNISPIVIKAMKQKLHISYACCVNGIHFDKTKIIFQCQIALIVVTIRLSFNYEILK